MSPETLLLTAVVMGLAGSPHCLGMCGGLAGAVTLSETAVLRSRRENRRYLILYNAGRVGSYTLLGLVAGSLGALVLATAEVMVWARGARLAAGGLLIAVGLGLLIRRGDWGLERLAAPLWRRLAGRAGRLLNARRRRAAFGLGLLWGALPCGLVYSAAAVALAAGDPTVGAAVMLAFGLGTLPSMLTAGLAAGKLRAISREWPRAAGVLVLLVGLWTALAPFWPGGHHGGLHHSERAAVSLGPPPASRLFEG